MSEHVWLRFKSLSARSVPNQRRAARSDSDAAGIERLFPSEA
ncbi:hypothetical protein [Natronomonas marina]|nr:hypothetical protein [Natronomonas marina]